jgi:hypothetical protein
MREITLSPEQIMTTNDFPVHNIHILKIYFRIAKNNPELLPPTPVIHISSGLPLLPEKDNFSVNYNKAIKKFFEENSEIEYMMCDGSHKTTALTLTHNKINAMLFENDEDIELFKQKEDSGEIFSFACDEKSIKEMLDEQAKHYSEAESFQTVKSKTDRMISVKVIPNYMIDYYTK